MEELQIDKRVLKRLSGQKANTKAKAEFKTDYLNDSNVSENLRKLQVWANHYESLASARKKRKKNRKYYLGDQWHEYTFDDNGQIVTEAELISSRGKIPFKQNMLRQTGRNLVGQYRSNPSKVSVITRKRDNAKAGEMLTNAIRSAYDLNQAKELDARNLEEFIISGTAVSKCSFRTWRERDKPDLFLENINFNRLFFNSDVRDIRLIDLRLIGEIKDLPLEDVIAAFAQNEKEAIKIKQWYSQTLSEEYFINNGLSADFTDGLSFFISNDPSKARVIEGWELESEWRTREHDYLHGTYKVTKRSLAEVEAENASRIAYGLANGVEQIPLIDAWRVKEQFWTVKFFTPYGHLLYQSETPYEHQSHPYTALLYPLIDGEISSLIDDLIDQQRTINRTISLQDFIIGASAKGVLLFPEDMLPDDMTMDDISAEWSAFDGVIKYKPKPGIPVPQQIAANSINIGLNEFLATQFNLFEKISGTSGAIQGQEAKAGVSGTLYAQQTMNSSINSKDMFDSYNNFKKQRDLKALKVIIQHYTDKRFLSIAGANYNEQARIYDPELVKNIEYDLVLSEGVDTPAYRSLIDEQLMKLLEAKMIDLEMYLQNTSQPYADKLLEDLRKRKDAGQQGLSPEMQQQVQQGADPQKMAMLNQMVAKV